MSLIGASPSTVGAINTALGLASTAIGNAISEAETYLAAQPGVAGMVAGIADPEVFFEYLATAGQDANLIAMQAYVSRMQTNLSLGAV